ncbi:MAG: hypothetical protein M9947_07230 [Thermomicrobiales bacterium]|nr:hypothetical protein [Thermomicrobiales bacterium]
MSDGARTPEELETLFEDSLLLRDGPALSRLFDGGATLVAQNAGTARGVADIARLALETWHGVPVYVADPRRVVQTHDLALIVTGTTINVARRGHDSTWRYAIVFVGEQRNEEMKGDRHDSRRNSSSDEASGKNQ